MPSNISKECIEQVNDALGNRLDFSSIKMVDDGTLGGAHWHLREDRSGAMPVPCEGEALACEADAKWLLIQDEDPTILDFLCVSHVLISLGPVGNMTIIDGGIQVRESVR